MYVIEYGIEIARYRASAVSEIIRENNRKNHPPLCRRSIALDERCKQQFNGSRCIVAITEKHADFLIRLMPELCRRKRPPRLRIGNRQSKLRTRCSKRRTLARTGNQSSDAAPNNYARDQLFECHLTEPFHCVHHSVFFFS